MEINILRNKVYAELDSRNLANPSIRKNALNHVLEFVRQSKYSKLNQVTLPEDKKIFKQEYSVFKNGNLSGAENSAINEMFNQYES